MSELTLTGASFNRGRSKQDYATPKDFREAVIEKFGMPDIDLAGSSSNYFCKHAYDCFTEKENSLTRHWHHLDGLCWLNPPFGNIEPWAAKCREENEKGARILFLVPASVGSFWFQTHIHGHAMVYFLRPRLCFDGIAPFPKDAVLCHCDKQIEPGYTCWKWK